MTERQELPSYPPAHNAWEYPPPPISRRWFWAPVLVVVLAIAASVGLIISAVVIMRKDFPEIIEDDQIVSVIDRECSIMIETVMSMPIKGTPTEQAAIVVDQNKAIANMLTEIRKVGSDVLNADPPTNAWLDDWDALIAAREAFAEQRRDGYDTRLRVPRDNHGDRIYERMDLVWLTSPVCEVPDELLNPYPRDVSAV
ncbi:MAG: hypothetical protein ABIN55_13410 [Aeromicrobium sp.]